jgi:GT2 family glycosyltransferase
MAPGNGAAAGPLAVVVVSYRVRDLLRACLNSVRSQGGAVAECWVFDNASEDGSADMVAAEFPEVKLVRSSENIGFARANNRVMQASDAAVFALVNPDVELSPGALRTAAAELARDPGAGVLGVALANADGSSQPSRFAFPGVWNQGVEALGFHRLAARLGVASVSIGPERPDHTGAAPWVSGACMLVTRKLVQATGGFSESFFMYGEEMEWCWRAHAAGFRVLHTTKARVLHHGGASGAGARGPLFVKNVEGRLAFLRTHRGAWRAAIARELVTLGAALRLGYWQLRAAVEGGQPRAHTREQLERFGAVVAWRTRRGR